MYSSQILLVVVLFSISSIIFVTWQYIKREYKLSCRADYKIYAKTPCDLKDDNCLTKSSNRHFAQFVAGMPGVDPSDPLHEDLIDATLPTLKLVYKNADLTGIKNCRVEVVRINSDEMKYLYYIECPHLTFEADYEMKGDLGSLFMEGQGKCKIEFLDHHFHYSGDSENILGKDGKPHLQLKNYKLDIEAKGKVIYEFKNLFNGDKEKSDAAHKFANENWQMIEKITREPTFKLFSKKYIDNVNSYLIQVAGEDLFYE